MSSDVPIDAAGRSNDRTGRCLVVAVCFKPDKELSPVFGSFEHAGGKWYAFSPSSGSLPRSESNAPAFCVHLRFRS